MCGVIGVYLTDVVEEDINLVDRIFRQTMIRGKHATGVTYVSQDGLKTIKEPVPVTEFLKNHSIKDFVVNDALKLIGHIRYSTSDLRYNQPFQGEGVSIAHNGVISQDPDVWEYKTETMNDSELILRCNQNSIVFNVSFSKGIHIFQSMILSDKTSKDHDTEDITHVVLIL